MQADHYLTLGSAAESRLKVERSEFLGLAFPCASDKEFFASLQRIEKQHFDASHHCWAFRIFSDQASGLGPRTLVNRMAQLENQSSARLKAPTCSMLVLSL